MDALYLVVRIAGQSVALATEQVGSVIEIDDIAPVPRVAPHVAGLFALRSRVMTVIDTRIALWLQAPERTGPVDAVIVTCDGHSYALIVDSIEDVIEAPAPEPCPAVLSGGWARAALGVVTVEGAMLPLLDPAVLIAGCRQKAA